MFWLLAICLLVCALIVVLNPNPLVSALFMILSFFFLAGLYVLLDAHFIAAMQILVYAGAIMVLFIFVVMLLNLRKEDLGLWEHFVPKAAGIMALFVLIYAAYNLISSFRGSPFPVAKPGFGTIERISDLLFNHYVFPFEAISILLLAAIVGAVVVAKRKI